MKKNSISKKLVAAAFGALVIGAGIGFVGANQMMVPEVINSTSVEYITETVEVPVEVIVEKNVTVEVPIEVEKIVEVDNENLKLVLDHIYDNDGELSYLTEDLDDDEIESIVERIAFINEVKIDAVNQVEDDLFDELDGMTITLNDNSTYTFEENDLRRLDVNDKSDDVLIEAIDFDDGEVKVLVTFDFRDEDGKEFKGSVVVDYDDGRFDDLEDIQVVEE